MKKHGRLVTLLQPVRKRMQMLRLLQTTAWGTVSGVGAAVLLLLASRVVPIPARIWLAICVTCIGLIAGGLAGLRRPVTLREAALAMDRRVTSDAVTTALERLDSDHPVAKMQREDAEQAASRYLAHLRTHLPGPGRSTLLRFSGALAVLVASAAVLIYIPNPMDERLAARAAAREAFRPLSESVDALQSQVEQSGLSQEERLHLAETLDEIRERLAKLDDIAEVPKALEDAKRQLARMAGDLQKQEAQLNALAQQMQSTRILQKLGQAMESQDAANIERATEQLKDELQRLSEEERKALSDRLKELAEKLSAQTEANGGEATSTTEAVKQALEKAAKKLADQSLDAETIDELGQALTDSLSAAQLESLAQQLAAQFAQTASGLAALSGKETGGANSAHGWTGMPSRQGAFSGSSGSNDGSGDSDRTGSGSSSNSGQGENNKPVGGSAQGTGAGTGNGQGNGQGAASGKAGGGSATGSGSGAGSGQGTGAGGAGAGSGPGSGSGRGGLAGGSGAGQRMLVTTPRKWQGEGRVEVDGGPTTGGEVLQGGQAPVLDGGLQAYDEVYAFYAAEARQSLNRSQLPPAMQQRVRDYFDQIQPNR